jgi:coenzyme F420 hydrogenase subunit beta
VRWGRKRLPEEVLGVHQGIFLITALDPAIAEAGQDGGLATAMLAYALEHDYIDAALVSYVDDGLAVRPGVARTREELLAAAGSRYSYSPNTLAFEAALGLEGVKRLGLVSVGCQTSIPAVSRARGARKVSGRFELVIGLLCSSTFNECIFEDLIEARYGVGRRAIHKVNIKGRLQLWTESRTSEPDVEIPLKECHPFRRAGCSHCPDFTAEHADISLGGIGKNPGATLTIIRSDLAAGMIRDMEAAGLISVRCAADHDPAAVELITKLAQRQRRRWPAEGPMPASTRP